MTELSKDREAYRDSWREKIKALITNSSTPLVAEVVHIPGEPIEPDEFRGEQK